jgi:hypothetical protein
VKQLVSVPCVESAFRFDGVQDLRPLCKNRRIVLKNHAYPFGNYGNPPADRSWGGDSRAASGAHARYGWEPVVPLVPRFTDRLPSLDPPGRRHRASPSIKHPPRKDAPAELEHRESTNIVQNSPTPPEKPCISVRKLRKLAGGSFITDDDEP